MYDIDQVGFRLFKLEEIMGNKSFGSKDEGKVSRVFLHVSTVQNHKFY